MPYFKMRLTANADDLADLRALPERARRIFKTHLQTDFKSWMQDQVDTLLPSLDPSAAAYPFKFGTEKSKWYYLHVLVPQGLVPTDGEHYERTGNLDESWRVVVSDQLVENLIKIENPTTAARYTIGPWQVAGHIVSGWGYEFDTARSLLREVAYERIRELWRQSILEAKAQSRRR